ncbi:citrate synthase [Sphingobium sp. B1D7B]|uniref:citrate synthase n=1 Tax=Sphingobium sp. B1D7B TaxID=2940578 RepID=UPI00222590F8|nr:citrate synthase [Sphingobium sp. B1D7B]
MSEDTDRLYVTAAEGARMLGIKPSSLYAYVSRGKIRSVVVPGEKKRHYWRSDIEQLAAGGRPEMEGALLPVEARTDGAPTHDVFGETALTFIGADGPFYRGVSAVALSQEASLEDVAALLWDGEVEAIFPRALPRRPADFDKVRSALASLGTLDQGISLLTLIESVNPRSYDFSPAGFRRSGGDALRWFATILVGADRPSDQPIHEFVTSRLGRPELSDVVRRLMILAAAHEFDPSSYAVRAAANAGVTPYQAVMAGIIAYRGHRLPMSRAEPMAQLLDDLLSAADPRLAVARRFRNGDSFSGFGSPMYGVIDPRAVAIMPALERQFDGDREFAAFLQAAAEIEDLTGRRPGLNILAALIGRKVGLQGAQQISFFVLGRAVGWIANAMEQFFSMGLVRPRAHYSGRLPAPAQR